MIGKREYNKAFKIVQEYQKQEQEKKQVGKYFNHNCFNFLWFDKNEKAYSRTIKAKSIDIACKKFISNLPKTISKIDYEVGFLNYFIDISDRKEFEKYI